MARPAGKILIPLLLGVALGFLLKPQNIFLWQVCLGTLFCLILPLEWFKRHGLASLTILAVMITLGFILAGTSLHLRQNNTIQSHKKPSIVAKQVGYIWENSTAALFKGILGGETRDMKTSDKRLFRRSGLAHLLAVSGIHVGIVTRLILLLFSGTGGVSRFSYMAVFMFLPVYIILLGWKVSVVRAVIMGMLSAGGAVAGNRGERINSFFVAALAVLIVDPASLLSAAFQLSFAATFGIISTFSGETFKSCSVREKFIHAFIDTFRVSVVAQLWVFPLVAWHFKSVSLISPVSNVLAFPLVFFLVPAGYVCVLVSFFSPVMAVLIGRTLIWPASYLLKLIS
ncbi:MAG: ComEC/Rec2 family competence protein, partial [bacterium]|nr:ComEC/Rec2 family competence protein [bacterium]